MSRTVMNNQLTAGATGLVDGYVIYSQITRLCTDQERIDANNRRREANKNARDITRNYTSMTISNPVVRTLNPNQPTALEIYLRESCYNSNSKNFQGLAFNALNKSSRLPVTAVLNKATGQYEPKELEHELAAGTKVTLSVRVFEANGNKGVSLDAVLIDELRYAEGTAMTRRLTDDLAAYGITMNWGNAAPATQQTAPQPYVAPQQAAPQQGYAAPQQGYQAPQQGYTPQEQAPTAPVASGNPFGAGMPAPQGGFTANKTY